MSAAEVFEPVPTTTATSYRLVIGDLPPTANQMCRMSPMHRHRVTQEWRSAGYWAAKEAKLPKLLSVSVTVLTQLKANKLRDVAAEAMAAKAAIDGALVDSGCLLDDSMEFVTKITFLPPLPRCGKDALVIELAEAA